MDVTRLRWSEGPAMSAARMGLHGLILLVGIPGAGLRAWCAGTPESDSALGVRLIHPDRHAEAVLNLLTFEGSRASSPDAALTAWKRATGNSGLLGKPVEAVMALSNPEMVREWRVLQDAELHLDLDPQYGSLRWFAIVPRDDGTVAAAITA